jgi:hypothetical protein
MISVGSGANSTTSLSIPAVSRNTIANDLPTPRASIGGPPHGYRAAVIALAPGFDDSRPVPIAPAAPAASAVPSTSAPQGGAMSRSNSRYLPSIAPLGVGFNPAFGWTYAQPGALPGSSLGGPTPLLATTTPQFTQSSGPNPIGAEWDGDPAAMG